MSAGALCSTMIVGPSFGVWRLACKAGPLAERTTNSSTNAVAIAIEHWRRRRSARDSIAAILTRSSEKEENSLWRFASLLHSASMDIDPHTLQQIIQRIYQQMRCPQCSKRVPVDFSSVRLASDDFLLLQLKCDTCDAFI